MTPMQEETCRHIGRVQELLGRAILALYLRAMRHDASKLRSPELDAFERYTPMLRGTTYGSPEYTRLLEEMRPALEHHYAHNSHHPEHFGARGVRGMSLLDVLEMLLDWRAATERHTDGDIRRSVELNQERFGYSDELKSILLNTLDEMDL